MFVKVTDKQLSDWLDYIIAYSSMGFILFFVVGWENLLTRFVMAVILHFCLSSRLYFEMKMRRKMAIKNYYKNLREGKYGKTH